MLEKLSAYDDASYPTETGDGESDESDEEQTMLEDFSAYDDPVLLGCEDDDDEAELLAFIIWVLFMLDVIERMKAL